MKHAIPHDLDHDLARRATRAALDSYAKDFAEYQPEGEWLDDDRATVRFTVMGRTISGRVQVTGADVQLELNSVPFIFRPFRKQAIEVIENEIRGWIQKARDGEL